jgi:2-oxoglutarate ferredoxin oxidoreductase subunit gamma
MAFRYSIRLGGAGGQGLIQAARIIAEAAAIYDNKNAAESCSYGPEARGSACKAEIIISDEAIDYPKADSIDFLMALTQQAYDKYIVDLLPEGVAVVDSRVEIPESTKKQNIISAPLIEMAEEKCGKSSMVDIVALGFFAGVNKVIGRDSIRQAILARIPRKSEDVFLCAYEAGLDASLAMRNE